MEQNNSVIINIASHDKPGSKGRYGVIELDNQTVNYELTTTEAGANQDLLQLSQVGARRIQHLLDVEISELSDINQENLDKMLSLPGVYEWHVKTWLEEAAAIRNGKLRIREPEEFAFLNDDNVILLDIETDLSQSNIWLVGLYNYRNEKYTHIFEKDDEERLLTSLTEYLDGHDEPSIVYYGNNKFDGKCLKRRMDVYELSNGIELMKNSNDLGIAVHNHLLGNFTRSNLESLSRKITDHESSYPDLDGFVVGKRYTEYLLDGDEPDWDKLIEYNKEDIFALKKVTERVRGVLYSSIQ